MATECDSKEAMGTSAGVVSISVGEKRKAETINSEDPGGSEGGTKTERGSESDEDTEEEFERITKWGYDSYENMKYDSADDPDEYSDKELEKQWRYYNRRVIESKGFFKSSDEFPMGLIGGIASVEAHALEGSAGKYGTMRQFSTLMASMCIEKYKEIMKKFVELEDILRVNYRPGGWSTYYITFAAKESESSNAPLVEYQAKTVADTKKEMNFVHKIPKKDGTLNRHSKQARTKITIPHEPDFATSQRAHRIRQKNDAKLEQHSTAVYRFKAHPLISLWFFLCSLNGHSEKEHPKTTRIPRIPLEDFRKGYATFISCNKKVLSGE